MLKIIIMKCFSPPRIAMVFLDHWASATNSHVFHFQWPFNSWTDHERHLGFSPKISSKRFSVHERIDTSAMKQDTHYRRLELCFWATRRFLRMLNMPILCEKLSFAHSKLFYLANHPGRDGICGGCPAWTGKDTQLLSGKVIKFDSWLCVKIRVWIGPRWSKRLDRSGSPAFWSGSGVWIGLWVQGMDRAFTFWLAAVMGQNIAVWKSGSLQHRLSADLELLGRSWWNLALPCRDPLFIGTLGSWGPISSWSQGNSTGSWGIFEKRFSKICMWTNDLLPRPLLWPYLQLPDVQKFCVWSKRQKSYIVVSNKKRSCETKTPFGTVPQFLFNMSVQLQQFALLISDFFPPTDNLLKFSALCSL